MREAVTKQWLKEKSREMQLPFAELLKGILLEDLLYKILCEDRAVRFVLETDAMIGEEAYRKGVDLPIRLLFRSKMEIAETSLQEKLLAEGEFEWELSEAIAREDGSRRFVATGHVEDMRVPLILQLESKGEHPIYMDLRSYRGLIHKDTLDYRVCAPELELADCICRILSHLELISGMDYYDHAYQIIDRNAVDGRRVVEELHRIWTAPKTVSLVHTVSGYAHYTYMKKRWISYCKNQEKNTGIQRQEIPWDELVNKLCTFMEPIYESFCKDEIFIGDWMPELGRFM